MAFSVRHLFQSAKADAVDATRVRPSNWNADHDVEMATNRLLGRTTAGDGAPEEITAGLGLTLTAGSLSVDSNALASASKLIGHIEDWPGPELPTGYLWCDGSAVNRTTYALLFAALTMTLTANLTATQTSITNLSKNILALGLVGAPVEGTGIPAGTTIVSATSTTAVLSSAATSGGTGVTIRILPHGRGNGTSTFNLPDRKGYAAAGRDNMGGSAANRLTAGTNRPDGSKLGDKGGTQTHTLSISETAAHTHTFTTGLGGTHSHTVDGALNAASGSDRMSLTGSAITEDTSSDGAHTHTGTTDSRGGGSAHNNVQPTFVTNFIIFTGV